MNNNLTIGITTFSKRKDLLINLINKIREITNHKILVCINGEQNAQFDVNYAQDILLFFSKHINVYPIFFNEVRGLSKLWNTIAIHSSDENVLILNDDLDLHNNKIFENIEAHIKSNDFNGFTKINNSFSHFIISKKTLDGLGYFDERLLGFGEEDGDIVYRCEKNNIKINNIHIPGFINLVSEIRHDHIKPGIGKYSKFNRDFIYGEKYEANTKGIRGMFDSQMIEKLNNINQYPYEEFFRENKYNI